MNFYLNKYGFRSPSIAVSPQHDLGIIVVIPCFNEENLIGSLKALSDCISPETAVEVITVINSGEQHSEKIKNRNSKTLEEGLKWAEITNKSNFKFHFIHEPNLPKKHAGVGLARKIGMDEAVHRFDSINHDGVIVCFDADSKCDPNYLVEIENHFIRNAKSPGCSIHYEHPLEGDEFEKAVYAGIINYELHLRYYNLALGYCGLPYAFHTVGSSMAVRSSAYQKQGGMNKRKAGEDFYFIHKIIALGNFTTLKTTRVIPSPRISDRVPFGTGKAIGDWISGCESTYLTYNFESFEIIKAFVEKVPLFYASETQNIAFDLTDRQYSSLRKFLVQNRFEENLNEIRRNSGNLAAFTKRFYRWFDAFKVLKLMHHFRDSGYENRPVYSETSKLIKALNLSQVVENEFNQLVFLRDLEKK